MLYYMSLMCLLLSFCSLLVQLARDLQGEFYPYFKDFFPILVTMTNTQDTNIIQVRCYRFIVVFDIICLLSFVSVCFH